MAAAAAAAAGGPANDGLKEMLQSAVQSVQWTYIIYWRFCHDKRYDYQYLPFILLLLHDF